MFARTDTSILGQWWWTVDRWTLGAILFLIGIGSLLVFASSPAVAETIGLDTYYFVKRHLIYLVPSFVILVGVSLASVSQIARLSFGIFGIGCIALMLVPLMGSEVKGAQRWLSLGGISLQPSEFVKPAFVVVSAWLFAEHQKNETFPGNQICMGLYALFVGLLFLQPDFGMVVLVSAVWFGQFFLAGLPLRWILGGLTTGAFGLIGAYFFLPHVTSRINRFLSPEGADKFAEGYQVSQSLEALVRGGILGQGPGEGLIKKNLPDAHSDFIFAVAAEEFGLLLCLLIMALFVSILFRGFTRVMKEPDLFIVLAVSGLLAQFGVQAMINISSTINLIPTKGMTLPLVSYGGSSILATCFSLGMVLSFTRRRVSGRGFVP